MAGPAPVAPVEGDVEAPVEDFRDDASLEEAGRAVAPVIVVSPQQGGASGAPGEATSSPMARSGTRLAPLGSTAEERIARCRLGPLCGPCQLSGAFVSVERGVRVS